MLLFAGRKHRLPDGTEVGYKVVRRGWALRTPLLETISRMDMRLLMVEVSVSNAYSKGGIPLSVHAIANVKLSSDPVHIRNAVERFLGMSPSRSRTWPARRWRASCARSWPSSRRGGERGRLKFAESLKANAQDDSTSWAGARRPEGQNVADEQQYLQNLGRPGSP